MTNGAAIDTRSDLTVDPSSSIMSALPHSTRQMALREDTTPSGSYVALSTSALLMVI